MWRRGITFAFWQRGLVRRISHKQKLSGCGFQRWLERKCRNFCSRNLADMARFMVEVCACVLHLEIYIFHTKCWLGLKNAVWIINRKISLWRTFLIPILIFHFLQNVFLLQIKFWTEGNQGPISKYLILHSSTFCSDCQNNILQKK